MGVRNVPGSAPTKPDLLDRTFRVAIILKLLDGILEIIGGVLLFLVSPEKITSWAETFTRHELSQDPNDWFSNKVLHAAHGLTGAGLTYAAIYLLAHGIVKVVLITALLRDRLWAYPWTIAFLLAFIVYQLYRIALRPTVGLIALTIFDVIVVWLTWREYGRHRARTHVRA
jgi:uncharacterized membrane protein